MKFEVELKEIEIYRMEVDADTEEEAIDKAYELIDTEAGKQIYHNDSDGASEVTEIEED